MTKITGVTMMILMTRMISLTKMTEMTYRSKVSYQSRLISCVMGSATQLSLHTCTELCTARITEAAIFVINY